MCFYDGTEAEAERYLEPLVALSPMQVMGGQTTYSKVTELPEFIRMPTHNRYGASSAQMSWPLDVSLIPDVFDKFSAVLTKYEGASHSMCMLDIRSYTKVASVASDATAYANRRDAAFLFPDLRWDDPALDTVLRQEASAITTYIREKLKEKQIAVNVQDDGTDFYYTNIGLGKGEERISSVFGDNLPRLKELKRKYDPGFLWDKWFPIEP